MKIKSISLKNFKTFQSAQLKDIRPMSVIVGANGSGKSTLFDVFCFLKEAMKDNVQNALNNRGGFKEVVSRGYEKIFKQLRERKLLSKPQQAKV